MTETEMKWFRLGKLLRRNLMAGVKEEPVAYLYNGVRLPDISSLTTVGRSWKHAFITLDEEEYHLFMTSSDSAPYRKDDGTIHFEPYATAVKLSTDGTYWEHRFNYVEAGDLAYFSRAFVWTSHDILNEDGSLYLAASEPIPIYE